ncbi:hypothetical protein, partial [Cronobacter sakazakii]|uniref:hypothetical protein n=1 Tax=Cronobacter sakazakii TaxID=28141 RepID=UPI001F48A357
KYLPSYGQRIPTWSQLQLYLQGPFCLFISLKIIREYSHYYGSSSSLFSILNTIAGIDGPEKGLSFLKNNNHNLSDHYSPKIPTHNLHNNFKSSFSILRPTKNFKIVFLIPPEKISLAS